jgi:HKD family nuclease
MIALNLPPLTNAQEEIADEIIRALDKAAEFKVDVAEAVSVKMAFNATRPHKHGGKLA